MSDRKPNAWGVEFRTPADTATGWSEWQRTATYPAIDVVEVDGADLTASGQDFDLGEVRASHHAKVVLFQSNHAWQVRTRHVFFAAYADKAGASMKLVGKYDG